MADNDMHPHATTLGGDLDMTSDPDLEVLRVAAAKAQEAAIKYQTQTTSLCGSRSFSPHSSMKDHCEVGSSPIGIQHTNQMIVTNGFGPAKERGKSANEGGSQEATSHISDSMSPNRRSSPGDSALGESLSDTEELVRQPRVTSPRSNVDTTTPMVDSTSNTEPEFVSPKQNFGPLLPHGVNTGSDGERELVSQKQAFGPLLPHVMSTGSDEEPELVPQKQAFGPQLPLGVSAGSDKEPELVYQKRAIGQFLPHGINTGSDEEPELVPQKQAFGSQLPHGVNTGSDGLNAGENTIRIEPHHVISQARRGSSHAPVPDECRAQNLAGATTPREHGPRRNPESPSFTFPRISKEFTGERSVKGKERIRLFSPKVSQGELLHKPRAASEKPKRTYQLKPYGLLESAMNNVASESSLRRSLPMSAQNGKKDKIQSGSNISHHNQESSSQRVRSFSRSEDLAFVQVFKAVVYPNIKASADRYKNQLSKDDLFHIGKAVSDEVVTQDFQNWVRENSYQLSDEQQKETEEFIRTSFSRRVSQITAIDLTSTVLDDDDDGGNIQHKSLTRVTSKGLTLEPFDMPTSNRLHVSNDLSRLGPGQISESAPTSAQIRAADDLSLLGPGQMPKLIGPVTGLKKSTAKARSFPKANSYDQSPGNFQDITLTSTPSHVLLSKAQNFDSTSLGDKEKPEGPHSTRPYAQRKQLASEKSRRSRKSAGADSPLGIVGGLGHGMDVSILSLDGNSDARQSIRSRDKLKTRRKRSYDKGARDACGMESRDGLTTRVLKKSNKKHSGKKSSLHTTTHASDKRLPCFYNDTSSGEDGEKVLAKWLSLSSKPLNPGPSANTVNDLSENSVNSLNTSDGNSIEKSSKTSLATDSGDAPQGTSGTSLQKNEARKLILSREASVGADDLACRSSDQPILTSNAYGSFSRTKSIRAIEEEIPRLILKFKIPRMDFTDRRSESLRERRERTSSQAQPDALDSGVSRGDFSTTVDPTLEQTIVALANDHSDLYRPYRSHHQNAIYSSDSHNTLKHVDFYDEECEALLQAIYDLQGQAYTTDANVSVRTRLRKMTQGCSYQQITELIDHVHADTIGVLRNRKRKGIRAFFSDLENGLVTDRPGFVRVEVEVVDPAHKPQRSFASLLRHRELGSDSKGGRFRNIQSELRVKTSQNILPWRSWKRASGDVVTCAWAPNSLTYAVGAAAPSNNEDLQYNRPHNLLLGDLISNVLQELPDHRVERPQPDMIPDGPNSSHDMYNNLDPMIYMTVSSLQFSRNGSQLITASHDKTAKVWDIPSSGTATCLHTLYHDTVVTGIDVSPHYNGLFATASKTVENSVRVYSSESLDVDGSILSSVNFSSPRAQRKLNLELYPECLRWGKTPNTSHILLAGFQQWGDADSERLGREGEICLWDVHKEERLSISPSVVGVLTAAWHPNYDMFAVGGVPVSCSLLSHPLTTRSIVRVWDTRTLKRYAVEYECPALDMQDVTFNPLHSNIVTAGCTDSATYVWDFRRPDEVLLKLQHDRPLTEWDHTRTQEEADAGIMMTLWGLERSHLYTGSSDGIVKCWDTSRAPEDALVRNVADLGAGVQSGAFSPDFSHLLIGDSDGVVHVLTSAPVDRWHNYTETDDDAPALEPIKLIEAEDPNRPKGNEGILAARKLLQTGQLVLNKSYGVGQGPNYSGPYARYARMEGTDPAVTDLLPPFDAMQPFSRYGQKRREIARTIKGVIRGRTQLIAQVQEAMKTPLTTIIKHDTRVKKEKRSAKSKHSRKKRARSRDEESSITAKRPKIEIIDLTELLSDDAFPPPPRRSYSRPLSCDNPIQLASDSDLVAKDGERIVRGESVVAADV